MKPQEFFEYRLAYFWDALSGYNRERDEAMKFQGNLTRRAVLEIFNTQVAKEDRIKSPEEFWKFPWDDEDREYDSEDPEAIKQHNQRLLDTLKTVLNERSKQT